LFFALSALGLGALLMASANLFQVIKWLGAAYLIVIGIKMLFTKHSMEADKLPVTSRRSLKLYSQGLITQLTNPKAILFFTALLPQFVSPASHVFKQFVVLGIASIAIEIPVLLAFAWLAERGGRLIPKAFSTLPERIAGVFLIGAGAGLASIRRP
jgi:homoserine/homoserine lactone efflux protein